MRYVCAHKCAAFAGGGGGGAGVLPPKILDSTCSDIDSGAMILNRYWFNIMLDPSAVNGG